MRTDQQYLKGVSCVALVGPNGAGKTTIGETTIGETVCWEGRWRDADGPISTGSDSAEVVVEFVVEDDPRTPQCPPGAPGAL